MTKSKTYQINGADLADLAADAERARDWAQTAVAKNGDLRAGTNAEFYTDRVWKAVLKIVENGPK
jgi:hypothetical protein